MELTTQLIHSGRPEATPAAVNPAIVRASTVRYSSIHEMHETKARRDTERLLSYGRRGTPTTFALEDAISLLEGSDQMQLLPSGVAAITLALVTLLKPGDHALIVDSVYLPVRRSFNQLLKPWGVTVTFFDGTVEGLKASLQENTALIYAEVPGSLTYDMLDLSALCDVANERQIPVVVDNTWASGYLFQPLKHGASISLMAGTKYVCGHSDIMLGSVSANGEIAHNLREMAITLGQCISPEDAYLALRGVRTLACRMDACAKTAIALGDWLATQEEVAVVHQPSRITHPGHDIWKRDFSGTNGLLTVEFKNTVTTAQSEAFIDALQLFGIGASWGGYESLVVPSNLVAARSLDDSWQSRGPCVRFSVGLESIEDLQSDLANAWAYLSR